MGQQWVAAAVVAGGVGDAGGAGDGEQESRWAVKKKTNLRTRAKIAAVGMAARSCDQRRLSVASARARDHCAQNDEFFEIAKEMRDMPGVFGANAVLPSHLVSSPRHMYASAVSVTAAPTSHGHLYACRW